MAKKAGILTKIRSIVRSHVTWLVASILGEDSLTKEEKASIRGFKLGKPILDFIRRSYLLGKLFGKTPSKKQAKLSTSDLDEFSSKYTLTPLDEVALAYSRTRAAAYVHSTADSMAASVTARMASALGGSLIPSIESAVRDEVTAALASNKQLKDFASSLATKLKIDYRDRLIVVASTELHSARIQGLVQSIVQKQDVFKYGDGLDSYVSIVPRPGTCSDCAKHYLDAKGNPKVHKLSTLLSMGSNADPGTKHTSRKGIHTFWKTTLPPMHPSCRCEVVFIPAGFTWVKGELKLTDPRKFHKSFVLRKATGVGTAPAKLGAVAKPKGPPQAAPSVTAASKPGNIPGVAAPQKAASVSDTAATNPAGSGSGSVSGSAKTWIYPEDGQDTSGPGWESYEKRDGTTGRRKEAGKEPTNFDDGTLSQEQLVEAVKASKAYGLEPHHRSELLEKLKNAKLVAVESLSGEEGTAQGITNTGFIASLEGGGRALAKPQYPDNPVFVHNGMGGVVANQGIHAEQAVDSIGTLLGFGGMTQPTQVRSIRGQNHSMQAWNESAIPLGNATDDANKSGMGSYLGYLATTDAEMQDYTEQMDTLATLAIVTNMADQHSNNILVDPKSRTLHAIDNSVSFGTGLAGTASAVISNAKRTGRHIKIPEHVMNKLENTSYSDVKKALPDLKPWQATQTYMRMKYVAHLQKTEGHLDPNKFLPVMYGGDEGPMAGVTMPFLGYWGSSENNADSMAEFTKRKEEKTLPDDLFQVFMAKQFKEHDGELRLGSGDSDFKDMLNTGPFINPGSELTDRTRGRSYVDVADQLRRIDSITARTHGKTISDLFPTGEKKFQDMMAAESSNVNSGEKTGVDPLDFG